MILYASILEQHMYGRLNLADSLRTDAWVRLEVILFVEEVICDLGNFSFVKAHLFSVSGRNEEAVAELI